MDLAPRQRRYPSRFPGTVFLDCVPPALRCLVRRAGSLRGTDQYIMRAGRRHATAAVGRRRRRVVLLWLLGRQCRRAFDHHCTPTPYLFTSVSRPPLFSQASMTAAGRRAECAVLLRRVPMKTDTPGVEKRRSMCSVTVLLIAIDSCSRGRHSIAMQATLSKLLTYRMWTEAFDVTPNANNVTCPRRRETIMSR